MFQDKYVFAQLATFLDRNHFNYLVRKFGGDKYVKHFTSSKEITVDYKKFMRLWYKYDTDKAIIIGKVIAVFIRSLRNNTNNQFLS